MDNINKCKEKIAVLMATYNGEKYIEEQLDSLLRQSCQDFNIYIHDDGSYDGTRVILDRYSRAYPNKIFLLNWKATGGAKNNFFSLIMSVEASYYMFCDQDDVWLEDKIELSYNQMKKLESSYGRGLFLIHSDLRYVDENLNTINDSYYCFMKKNQNQIDIPSLIKKNLFVGCTLMFNKALRDEAVMFESLNNIYMHDWWIGLLASMLGHIAFIESPTMLYRQHSNNVTGNKMNKSFLNRLFMWKDFRKSVKIKREFLNRKVLLAVELLYHMKSDNENFAFIEMLSKLNELNKMERIRFYQEYGLFEQNKCIPWQLIWV